MKTTKPDASRPYAPDERRPPRVDLLLTSSAAIPQAPADAKQVREPLAVPPRVIRDVNALVRTLDTIVRKRSPKLAHDDDANGHALGQALASILVQGVVAHAREPRQVIAGLFGLGHGLAHAFDDQDDTTRDQALAILRDGLGRRESPGDANAAFAEAVWRRDAEATLNVMSFCGVRIEGPPAKPEHVGTTLDPAALFPAGTPVLTLATVEGWTDQQMRDAEEYAGSVSAVAGDADDVAIPAMPPHLWDYLPGVGRGPQRSERDQLRGGALDPRVDGVPIASLSQAERERIMAEHPMSAELMDAMDDDPFEAEACLACGVAMAEGDEFLRDRDGEPLHAACSGPEREAYFGPDGEPLKDGDPLPTPMRWEADRG